ncbi:orotidine 5 -phosphate decarboxylase [Leptolyngbya sp. Heron Island J]|uniref:orotidine-5'-phosphate decarboxylase n=1 Tax=Leptolyngbya sp. Heron Island J TaxID=1385935 RepID=UPI0003B97C3E|nr:orotidine-5'-phosphate decarboxylase [Leptolyngbya sp. Heron Island J]ESA34152.1 orotidine 5 -phosphate decarboxylase [Leptolyngbya sp. Heron Island J]
MMATNSVADRIIVPLDVPSMEDAIALLDRLPDVTFWKVGLELFVSAGPAILEQLKQRQKRIFLDLKFHDIPNTMAGACRAAGRYGVDLVTVHAPAGKVALQAAQAAALEGAAETGCPPPNLIAVTLLTSINPRTLAMELKVSLELTDYALQMALLAQESSLSGIVCSPQEAADLRRVCGDQFLLVCPGVRPTGVAKGDQQRAMTPAQAIAAGASYLVVGRPITQAADPAISFRQICDEIAGSRK